MKFEFDDNKIDGSGVGFEEIDLVDIPTVKNALNAYMFPKTGERTTQPSITVPDDVMSIREILYRYARGLDFSQAREPVYDEETGQEFPDLTGMDYAEIHEMYEQAKQDEFILRQKLKQLENEKDVNKQEAKTLATV